MVTSNGNLKNLVDTQKRPRKAWREVLDQSAPLLLPVAHDALTARVIEQAGYPAYQIGGFALVGSRFAYPDIDLLGVPGDTRDPLAVPGTDAS